MTLSEATRQYQAALEFRRWVNLSEFSGYRGYDEIDEAELAVGEAEREMNAAWLRHVTS